MSKLLHHTRKVISNNLLVCKGQTRIPNPEEHCHEQLLVLRARRQCEQTAVNGLNVVCLLMTVSFAFTGPRE